MRAKIGIKNYFFPECSKKKFPSKHTGENSDCIRFSTMVCCCCLLKKKIREITIFYKSVCTKVNYEECHKFSYGREGVSGGNGQKMCEILVHNW